MMTQRNSRPDLLGRGAATAAGLVLRYGLVLIILWFGIFKFTETEALAIQPLLENSPFLSWMYAVLSVRGASAAIGSAEIAIAALIAIHPLAPRLSAIGGVGAVLMFLTTLSFLATTPGMFATVDGVLVPSGMGGFVIKDLLLLGAALWSMSESLHAAGAASGRAGIPSTPWPERNAA